MNCKGCLTAIRMKTFERKICVIANNAPKRNCPCQQCLVKTTCDKQCEDFITLLKSIHKFKKLSYDYKKIVAESYGFSTINPTYKQLYPEV